MTANNNFHDSVTVPQLYRQLRDHLRKAGIEGADSSARMMIRHVLGVSDADFITGAPVAITPAVQTQLDNFMSRRLAGEPVSRILGEREFWGLNFKVTPDVLDPRPDTETIIEAALRRFPDQGRALRLLDLGTGSGCLIVALLCEYPQAQGVAVDISPAALAVAQENAVTHNVMDRLSLYEGDWFAPLPAGAGYDLPYDLIVSNPPYIANPVIGSLAPEVKNHDPILALSGGDDGLDAYKIIISQLKNHLAPGGTALLEIGYDQHEKLLRLVGDSMLSVNESYRDLAGNPRVVEISTGEK